MEIVEVIFFVFFVAMFFLVLTWLFLTKKLFKLIEKNHPDKYRDMGEPNLVTNNSLSTNIAFMRYLYNKEWKQLDDLELSSLSYVMYRIFIVTIIVFLPAMIILPLLLMPPLSG